MNEVGKRGSKNKGKIRAVLMRAEIRSWGNREGKRGEEAEPWRGNPSKVLAHHKASRIWRAQPRGFQGKPVPCRQAFLHRLGDQRLGSMCGRDTIREPDTDLTASCGIPVWLRKCNPRDPGTGSHILTW